MEEIITENIEIPVVADDILLKGSIYFTPNTPSKAPWIINFAGLYDHRESYFVKYYTERFVKAGYYVLSYDYRGHGETAKQTGKNWMKFIKKIFMDIHDVISWVLEEQSNRVLDKKIALFGRSFGGAIILTHGYIDERAKILISLCTRYDYSTVRLKFPEEIIKKMSPKYYLKKDLSNNERILIVHSKDDDRIPFNNLFQIKEQLGLNDENVIIYNTGGHSFKGHREELFLRSIEFLKRL